MRCITEFLEENYGICINQLAESDINNKNTTNNNKNMINFKNFDRKKLFKSKFKIAILILALTLAICSISYLGIKKSSTQKIVKDKGKKHANISENR